MYLRISKGRQKSYLVLVEGYREDGKVKQRTICNLGAIDKTTAKQSLTLGKNLLNRFGASAIIDGSELIENSRNNWGAYEVMGRLWQLYGLEEFWRQNLQTRKIQYDLPAVLQLMIAGRICKPSSKLGLYENQSFYDGFSKFELQTIYKALDELDYYKDYLSKHLFAKQQQIHGKVTIAFFDVTTMYFESVKSDELREFGFSKDCKFGEVQVVLSLVSDAQGNPLAYELFPGNVGEGNTFIDCLKSLQEKYELKKAVVVADRGMYSAANLQTVVDMGFEYIVGTRLRSSPEYIKKQVLQEDGYKQEAGAEFKYKLITRERKSAAQRSAHTMGYNEYIVASWSKKRADKNAKDRARLVEKAMSLLGRGNTSDKRGGKKYLKLSKAKAELDSAKIAEDACWDGFYGVSTNSKLDAQQILAAYHNLWKIEESFRIMKNYFQTRPMFHWTKERISGHIMLNFIAMIFERYIENSMGQKSVRLSPERIRTAINGMQKSVLTVDKNSFVSYANLSADSIAILQNLRIQIPRSHALK